MGDNFFSLKQNDGWGEKSLTKQMIMMTEHTGGWLKEVHYENKFTKNIRPTKY